MKRSTHSKNPRTKYYHEKYPRQRQAYPGLESKMHPLPDCGEDSYIGANRLTGRRALITGGDSGIGRAVAIAYAREGADVAISYLPAEESDARETAKYIEDAGQRAILIPGDIANEKFCERLITRAHKALGGLDIIVMNAGMQQYSKDITKLDTEQLVQTFAVNVFSMFWLARAAIPLMRPGASIITTSSIQAYQPGKDLLDYASTKGAIVAFTRALAKQVAPRGIRVNSVAPGPIWTALQVAGGRAQDTIPEFGMGTPMGRAGQPAELAATYVLLASDASSYTTAEVYGVTGGNHTM
ncbi:MAG: SDR family oxidoreductase [Alphaproteobacteria bacterium]|nr:SDR family oxidoreductase [Alphaproteobacteria bacterium]